MENKLKVVALAAIALGVGAWSFSQSGFLQSQDSFVSEHFKTPNKNLLLNGAETNDVISFGEITLHESSKLSKKDYDTEPLNLKADPAITASPKVFIQTKHDIKPKKLIAHRSTQFDQLSDQYGLQFLPDSILGDADEETVLRSSRRFIERQLLIKSDDAQLIELAQQAGVNDAIIRKFQAQTSHPANFSTAKLSPTNLQTTKFDGRRSANSHQPHLLKQSSFLNQYQSLKPGHAAIDGSRPSQQGHAGKKQVIDPVVESLRRSLIANTSISLAKLQLNELGLTN